MSRHSIQDSRDMVVLSHGSLSVDQSVRGGGFCNLGRSCGRRDRSSECKGSTSKNKDDVLHGGAWEVLVEVWDKLSKSELVV